MFYAFLFAFLLAILSLTSHAATCPPGTFQSYNQSARMQPDGTYAFVCTQGGPSSLSTVTYKFPKNFYSIVGIPGVTAKDITVRLDPNGPYTLLVGSQKWNPGPRQNFKLTLHFTVKGATKIGSWIHDCRGAVLASITAELRTPVTAAATCSNPIVYASYNDVGETPANVAIGLEALSKMRSFGIHFHP
jgi:hypothetical protein